MGNCFYLTLREMKLASHDKYDLVVLGDDIGGLVASSLLAKRGVKTLLVGRKSFRHCFEQGEHRFMLGSSLFAGFERDGLFDHILSELGTGLPLLQNEDTLFHCASPFLQVILPENRLNICENLSSTLSDLKREFPDSGSAINAIFSMSAELRSSIQPYYNLVEGGQCLNLKEKVGNADKYLRYLKSYLKVGRRKSSVLLNQTSIPAELLRLFDLLLFVYHEEGLEKTSGLSFLSMLWMLEKKLIGFCNGGNQTMLKILMKIFLKNGGTFIEHDRLGGIETNGKKATGVTVDGELVGLKDLILNIRKVPKTEHEKNRKYLNLFYACSEDLFSSEMHDSLVVTDKLGVDAPTETVFWVVKNFRDTALKKKRGDTEQGLRVIVIQDGADQHNSSIDAVKKAAGDMLINLVPFAAGKLRFLGAHIVENNDTDYHSYPGEGYKQIFKTLKVQVESGQYVASTPYHNIKIIPRVYEPFVSTGIEAKNGFNAANNIKKPLFGYIKRKR